MTWDRLCLLLLLAGCVAPPPPMRGKRPAQFTRAEEAYLSGDTSRARLEFERFRLDHPRSTHIPWAFYFEGRCLLLEDKPILAQNRFEAAANGFGDPGERAQAAMGIGDALFQQDRYDAAEKAYLSARGSGGVPTDEILYKSALCARRGGRWDDAERRFQEISHTYPNGTRAVEARRNLEGKDRFFSIQTGTFRVRSNADKKLKAMETAGLETRIQPVSSRAGTLYRVCVGRYPDYGAAKQDLASLRQKGVITDARIIP